MFMTRTLKYLLLLIVASVLHGCYHQRTPSQDGQPTVISEASDNVPLDFESTHHYSRNYNFVVKTDSLPLIHQQPDEAINNLPTDTLYIKRNDHIVVADIRILSNDRIDSVWVQVARDQSTFGWIHEKQLLQNVVPDDPIAQFISTFSDMHLLIFLIIISVIAISYILHNIFKKNAYVVHFNDIDSIYPTLLAICVAAAATLYSSIQLFAPDTWRHFYYHPSLNPFSLPLILGIFVSSVWALLIVALAAFDDVKNQLSIPEATMYLCGLAGICAANYIIFSIATLYYIGYVMLAAYVLFAIRTWVKGNHGKYVCGNCGHKLNGKGICPYCGAMND